ncbi:hypothetical protein C8A05DRAFT_35054 [Staphylotrichum tortipilum]|uniref:Uncharacterized protein n=1 Tax=Staphylotrichum tortipilum TaxID=2831512 RepID=A0AAN6MIG9_9PEZI|nr:hypothetical protein C8A05DRAFT_35054 [Staphylotrichum longicolle]
MATMVLDDDEAPPRAPITPSKTAFKVKKESPATKRPRGRPRKQKNNTIDTAIILSDSEAEEDDDAPVEQTNKRPLSRVESPMPPPRSKRPAQGVAGPSAPTTGAMAAAQSEIEELHRLLDAESRRRADLENQKTTLRALLQEKEASWAADLAAQTVPLQVQLLKLAKDKEHLSTACRDLDQKLLLAAKDRDAQLATQKAAQDSQEIMADMKAQMLAKDNVIKDQVATIQQLKDIAASRLQDLGEADERIAALTQAMQGFATRHAAATKLIKEHEAQIQALTEALSASNNSPGASEGTESGCKAIEDTAEKLRDTGRQSLDSTSDLPEQLLPSDTAPEGTSGAAQESISETEQKMTAAKKQLAVVRGKHTLMAMEDETAGHVIPSHTTASIISALGTERATLHNQFKVSTTNIVQLEDTVARLQEDKIQLEHANQQHHEEHQKQVGEAAASSQHKSDTKATASGQVGELSTLMEQPEQQDSMTVALGSHDCQFAGFKDPAKFHPAATNQPCESQLSAMAALQIEKQHMFQKYQNAVEEADELRGELAKVAPDLADKAQELAQLKGKLEHGKEQWRADIRCLATKLRDQTRLVETKEQEAEQLRQKLEAARADATELDTEIKAQCADLVRRQVVITHQANAIKDNRAEIEQLRESASGVTADQSTLHEQLTSAKAQIQDLQAQLNKLTTENDGFREKTQALKLKMAELATHLAASNTERDALNTRLGASKTEAAFLRAQLAGLTQSAAIFAASSQGGPANVQHQRQGTPSGSPALPALCPTLNSPLMFHPPRPNSQPLPSRPPTPVNPIRAPTPHTAVRTENTTLRKSHDALTTTLTNLHNEHAALVTRLTAHQNENARLSEENNAQRAEIQRLRGRLREVEECAREVEGLLSGERERMERVRGWVGQFPGWREVGRME